MKVIMVSWYFSKFRMIFYCVIAVIAIFT